MRKFAMQFRIALLSIGFLALQPVSAENDVSELDQIREKVSGMFDEIDPEHIQPSPIDGWYTVRKGAVIAYISGSGRYLLQGDLIDLDTQTNLSENERNKSRVEMMSVLDDEQRITFAPEEVKYTISVFTDIDCAFCRRLHSHIDEYLAAGIKIHYLLYPRNGPTSESWVKAEKVWCADDRKSALTLAKIDKEFPTRSCDSSMVSKHYAMGRDVGLTGTPAIVFADGTLIAGYLPPAALAARLAEAEALSASNN